MRGLVFNVVVSALFVAALLAWAIAALVWR